MASHRQTLRALKRLRRVYRVARDQAAAALAGADTALTSAERSAAEAQAQRLVLADDFGRRARGASTAGHFEIMDAERDCAEASLGAAQKQVRQAACVRREHAGRVAAAERQLAVADRVHQRTAAAFQRAVDRAEQATIDDMAPSRIKDDP